MTRSMKQGAHGANSTCGAMAVPIESELYRRGFSGQPVVIGVLELIGAAARDQSFTAEDETEARAFAAICATVLELSRSIAHP
mmetsp:Transcript_23287/g.65329  ORF Transcript_23287/g.65329 Transcript_23287/m.65329 type:complete len:83 (+) Transcript_23287:1598-1846(+)